MVTKHKGNTMNAHTIGNNYDATKSLGIKDLAKLVRKDLKATFGKTWKFSVRIERYSMGQSMHVEIKSAPCSLYSKATSPRALECDQSVERTAAADLAIETINAITASYNYNDSDSMTDYYSVRFASYAQINYALENAFVG